MAIVLGKMVNDLLTNNAYGFPTRGHKRRIKPVVLAVIHITSNPNNQGKDAAQNERNYANRKASNGPSAHYYINRDGGGVRAIGYIDYAAWSNGDVDKPNTKNAGVVALLKLKAHNYNVNEGCAVEIENVGYPKPEGQLTEEQIRRCARIIAQASIRTGLKINRNTVLAHADINSVDRSRCPALPSLREELLTKIIQKAQRRKKWLLTHK